MGLPNIVALIGSVIAAVGFLIAQCALASISGSLGLETILYILFIATIGFMLFKGNLFHEDIMKVLCVVIGISTTLVLFFLGVVNARANSGGNHGAAAGLFVALIGTGIVSFSALF